MPSRPSWDGFLKFNLIAVPVKAFNAVSSAESGRSKFHLIHAGCGQRIRYQKVCPVHGEVDKDDIVSAYEVAKDEYVPIESDEMAGLRAENDKAVDIDVFVASGMIDPLYFAGRTYFLVPDGKIARKPYQVLREAMREEDRYGIARIVLSGRQHVVAVRAYGDILTMTILLYADQVKSAAEFEDELGAGVISAEERRLARTLIQAATDHKFHLERYKDEYTDRLQQLLDAKAHGKKYVSVPREEEPAVINLMDALRASLEKTQKNRKSGTIAKKKAPGGAVRPARHHPRKKTG